MKPHGTERIARASGLYRTDSSVSASAARRAILLGQLSRPRHHHLARHQRRHHRSQVRRRVSGDLCRRHAGCRRHAPRPLLCDRLASSLADLDSEAVFNKHAVEEIASLAELRKAPLVEEEYHGPLLLSSDAATDTLRSLLPPRSRPRAPRSALRRAPTVRLPRAITRA